MYDDKIEKLIERFRETKNDKGLTDEQISEISNLPSSWIERLLNGENTHPGFYETMILASALEVSINEINKILGIKLKENNGAVEDALKEIRI